MGIKDFIAWLAGGGFIMAASFILERIAWYQALTADKKEWVFLGSAAVIGCGAVALATYVPAAVLTALAPYFGVVFAVFSYVFLGKAFHNTTK
jgi:hypothetical protein